jgi:hypothetical protein
MSDKPQKCTTTFIHHFAAALIIIYSYEPEDAGTGHLRLSKRLQMGAGLLANAEYYILVGAGGAIEPRPQF